MAINVPGKYYSLFEQAANKYKVPLNILLGVAQVESGFNPEARSPAGAMGMMQFMPGTAKQFGINPWDVNQAIPAAAKYLADEYKHFGDWSKAVTAYNAGRGNVTRGTLRPESIAYGPKVFKAAGMEFKPFWDTSGTTPSSGSSNAQPTTTSTVTTTVAPGSAYYPGSMPTYMGNGYTPARMFNQSNDGAMSLAWNMFGQYVPYLKPLISNMIG